MSEIPLYGGNGVPLWARVVAYLGFPISLSIGLIWFLLTVFSAHNEDLRRHAVEIVSSSAIHVQAAHDEHALQLSLFKDVLRTLRAVCINMAQSKLQEVKCVDGVGPKGE